MNKNKIAVVMPIAVAGILTLAVLAAISSANEAFAQKKPTTSTLTVSVSPINTRNATSYEVKGRLTSDGSGVGGATITFTTLHHAKIPGLSDVVTLPDGTYFKSWIGPLKYGAVVAHYAGDSAHMSADQLARIRSCAPYCTRG